jgi:hypothetical protein
VNSPLSHGASAHLKATQQAGFLLRCAMTYGVAVLFLAIPLVLVNSQVFDPMFIDTLDPIAVVGLYVKVRLNRCT